MNTSRVIIIVIIELSQFANAVFPLKYKLKHNNNIGTNRIKQAKNTCL